MDVQNLGFEHETALQMLIRLGADGLFFRTNLPELDPILALFPARCYEIDGDIGVGKTQICFSLAANVLETKRTARIGWISAIPLRTDLLAKHLRTAESLDRIVCRRVEKLGEFRQCLDRFCEMPNVQLVFIEDVDAVLHDTVYDKQDGKFVQMDAGERIRKLTGRGITVVVTNHISRWRGYPAPALGNCWAAQISNRFYVEKRSEESDVRVISTLKQGSTEPLEIRFRIGDRGLEPAGS